jgi:hypothetical protein
MHGSLSNRTGADSGPAANGRSCHADQAEPSRSHPTERSFTMPRMLVTTESPDRSRSQVLLDERVAASDLASAHFASQLVERIGWALADAESVEARPTRPVTAM